MKLSVELSPDGALRCWYPDGSAVAGYYVDIPPTKGGLELLIDILSRREKPERHTTGMRSQPTQYDIEKLKKEFVKKPKMLDGVNLTELGKDIEI